MDLAKINYLAVLAAGVAYFLLGGLWYSPLLFANAWIAEMKFSPEHIEAAKKAKGMGKTLATTFALGLLMAFVLALLLQAVGPRGALASGALGLLVSFGFVATTTATNYLHEGHTLRLLLITTGCPVIGSALMGLILGAWR